jgi:DGQHR domain-containing protein
MSTITYLAAQARQSSEHTVLTFAATAADVLRFARIDRVGRDQQGSLFGFQRPQIASHIREIQDYLERPDSVLPNAVVVAFTEGVKVTPLEDGIARIEIELKDEPAGLVVDGQQRLTALNQSNRDDFQIFVSVLVCQNEAELRRQFVLINNTRPLPKSLIYELLPTVDGLPERLEGRSIAADLTQKLNYDHRSSLQGQIRQHTNPRGVIVDTAIQRVLMTSLNDGVMRDLIREPRGEVKCFELISAFYSAVQTVFADDWKDQKPSTSRLVHGAGIQALGYVMEVLAAKGARKFGDFVPGLNLLEGRTAWRSGSWDFGGGDVRHWKAIQNVHGDVVSLAHYLISVVRTGLRNLNRETELTPMEQLLEGADS